MKKTLLSPPDQFSLLPMLSLLPSVGDVGRLEAYSSSLFARLETVQISAAALSGGDADRELLLRLRAEEGMLTTVLDWLSSTGGRGGRGSDERLP